MLMAVIQSTKKNTLVNVVLYVHVTQGKMTQLDAEKLCKRRDKNVGEASKIVDLKSTCLQLHIAEVLEIQVSELQGKTVQLSWDLD